MSFPQNEIEDDFGRVFLDDMMSWFVNRYGPRLPPMNEEDHKRFFDHFSGYITWWIKKNLKDFIVWWIKQNFTGLVHYLNGESDEFHGYTRRKRARKSARNG